ncbi:ATP-binding protein [Paraburkholderia sediminicola]
MAIQDTGCGIPKEQQLRLFRPFERVKSRTNAKIEGAGLGLLFVKTVVERHGGRIMLDSEVEHGATFTITLPGYALSDDQIEEGGAILATHCAGRTRCAAQFMPL